MDKTALATAAKNGLMQGTLAAGISGLLLPLLGRRDSTPAAPVNAVSHWIWPEEALRQDRASWRYTGTGALTHYLAAMFWCLLYGGLRTYRPRKTPLNAVTDAVAVTAVAAVVDLKVVPKRLTPGFEHKLSKPSLTMVYAGFAAGLAIGGLLALRGRRDM